ncbi:MAG TPA: serine--tRNA ligase [Chloroflexi bacterium]|nr:MAG: serine--tRNA ligase [Chloroflexota bacterium]HDD54622.1 serine--tRNA ligase [Chloroflexota bacterium]
MLDIQIFRENPDLVRQSLQRRRQDISPVDQVIDLDQKRRALLQRVEGLRAEKNQASKAIGQSQDPGERQEKIADMKTLGVELEELETELKDLEPELEALLSTFPNLVDDRVPEGADESENQVMKTVGEKPEFDFQPQPHWDLGPALGILDFERGVKLSGTRFYILNGIGARLQRALVSFMLDSHTGHGYEERYTPFMVKEEVVYASGQLPKFADNLYHDHEDDFWWVPTAEVPLTSLHKDEILNEEDLPISYTAYTPCFRREKMSAGREVRGIKRGHQFDKVEMYIYCRPEDSEAQFLRMQADAERICLLLDLPYRVNNLCTGDLGFAAAYTSDIEVWAAGCGEWLEVSSVSNTRDFQARRAAIRYRPDGGKKTHFVHTLNGSGLALPRVMIAVLENNQQKDGSVVIPEVLHPWMGGVEVIEPL